MGGETATQMLPLEQLPSERSLLHKITSLGLIGSNRGRSLLCPQGV